MSRSPQLRIFLDSNVIVGGIVARWGLDKAALSICASRICQLVLAEPVHDEVERNLKCLGLKLKTSDAEALLEVYRQFLRLSDPERIPYPGVEVELTNRHLIRHGADLPVLLSAMAARPDWLLTNNSKHFTQAVAVKTSLRIATPAEFLRAMVSVSR
jgi:predicted nucleic acid-binding protein